MTKEIKIISQDGMIGICRDIEQPTNLITEVPDDVSSVDVLSELAMFEPGRVPRGTMTYQTLQNEIARGFNAFKPRLA